MSKTEYHFRVVVELVDDCGRWHVALWQGAKKGTEQAHFYVDGAEGPAAARRVWGQVAGQERHPRLLVDLAGWAGWRLHPVTTYRRWVNDDGSVSGWHVHAELEGTRLVEGGCLVTEQEDEVAGDDRRMA